MKSLMVMIAVVAVFGDACSAAGSGAGSGADAKEPRFAVLGFGGLALNLPSDLTIIQAGQTDIEHRASWQTRPMEQPLYWALRLRRQTRSAAWELQLLHHKIYLQNNPQTIEHFEVTHGLNILTVNRVFRRTAFDWRIGAGVTLPHAESTVRGQHASSPGYQIAGPAVLGGVGKEYHFTDRFFGGGEVVFIAAWANVDVAGGEARVRNFAFHVLVGIGATL